MTSATPAEAVTGKTMEDLVQATVQPAAVGGSVTYSPEQVAIVKASIDREVWECSGIELSDDALDSAAHAAIQNFLLLHRSDDRTESQRQNETDSLRLERDALTDEVETLRRIIGEIRMLANAGTFKEFDGEPWLLRVRNIDIHTPVAALTASKATGERS
jgi:hypothetical protein